MSKDILSRLELKELLKFRTTSRDNKKLVDEILNQKHTKMFGSNITLYNALIILAKFDLKELLQIRGTSKTNKLLVDEIINIRYIKTYGADKNISINQKINDLAIDLRPVSSRLRMLMYVFPELRGTDYARIAQSALNKQPIIISLSMRDKLRVATHADLAGDPCVQALEGGLEWRGVFFFNPEWDVEKHEIICSSKQRPLYISFTQLNNGQWFPIATIGRPKARQTRENVLAST